MFYIEEFLNYLKSKQYGFYTLHAYRRDLKHFREYCIRYGVEDVKNNTKQMTFKYLARRFLRKPAATGSPDLSNISGT